MSRDRFELIKRYIHFDDNSKDKRKQDEKRDRLFKIRPLFEVLKKNCLSQEPEEYNSIDEQITTFKDRRFSCCYMPNKPYESGFKVFSWNETSGMLYHFELEGTPDPDRKEQVEELRYSGAGVVILCDFSWCFSWWHVFTDPVDSFIGGQKVKGGWLVSLVLRIHVVKKYNASMDGVHLFDMFQSLYRMDHKSKRWCIRIFYWIKTSSVINAWLRYRKGYIICNKKGQFHDKSDNNLTLIQFTMEVSSALVKNTKPAPRKRVGQPTYNDTSSSLDTSFSPKRPWKAPDLWEVIPDIRHDKPEHWPSHREDRPRCFLCQEKARLGCSKCENGLCLTKDGNCFLNFQVDNSWLLMVDNSWSWWYAMVLYWNLITWCIDICLMFERDLLEEFWKSGF